MTDALTINNQDLIDKLRIIPDFPKPGIQFYDITTLLADPEGLRHSVDRLAGFYSSEKPDIVVGLDARGFILASALAYKLGCGLALVRKKGKLPFKTYEASYTLEYGTSTLEIHTDTFATHKKALLVDDLLATGGTANAAVNLVKRAGGHITGFAFLIELTSLNGRGRLSDININALMALD